MNELTINYKNGHMTFYVDRYFPVPRYCRKESLSIDQTICVSRGFADAKEVPRRL